MVEYSVKQHSPVNGHINQLLREADEYFYSTEGASILGEGIKDIFTDETLFNQYVEKLTEDVSGTEAENMKTLMENARVNTLLESATAGISPVASLTLPTLRVMWAKTGLVHAIPTEPVKSNAFSVSFNRPCIIDEDGNKHYLPEALDEDHNLGDKKALQTDPIEVPATAYDLLGAVGSSKAVGDSIDRDFRISAVTIDGTEYAIKREVGKLDINNRLYVEVEDENKEQLDIVFGAVDLWNGTINLASLNGEVESVKIVGYVASDAHNTATNISFEMVRKDFQIPTGEHFEAALPIEFIQDTMATYSIDGTTEVVDVMSNVIAQKVDEMVIDFIKEVYDGTNNQYFGEFDLRPSSSYAGNPKDWRDELKTVIDYLAADMKQTTHLYQGYFVIMGNPVDMMLIPNVNWTFNSAVDTQSGIEVNYSLGATSGQQRYQLISSDLIPMGAIYMLFVPTIPSYKTVVYYPYTFNCVNQGYLNTRTPNVPSIMMTKRQIIEDFMPLVVKINILNNTADMLAKLPR